MVALMLVHVIRESVLALLAVVYVARLIEWRRRRREAQAKRGGNR